MKGVLADRDRLSVGVGGTWMAREGEIVPGYDEKPVVAHMKGREVEIQVDLGLGKGKATVWTCDGAHGYIDINGACRSCRRAPAEGAGMALVRGGTAVPFDNIGFDFAAPLSYPGVAVTPDSVTYSNGSISFRFDGYSFQRLPDGRLVGAVTGFRIIVDGQDALVSQGTLFAITEYVDWVAQGSAYTRDSLFIQDDGITGTGWNDRIAGLGRNDTIVAGNGNDTLGGGHGDDVLDGGAHADSMAGGIGNDTYVVDWGGDIVVEAPGQGYDTALSFITWILPADVEHLRLLGSAVGAGGNALGNIIYGNDVANLIDGQGGDDALHGLGGNDTILGRGGNDGMLGGDGADAMDGGTGDDQLRGEDGNDVLFGREGRDRVEGGDGDDILYGGSNDAPDTGNNIALGGAGRDTIVAGNGEDTLLGGDGDDFLYGSNAGTQQMVGGPGADDMLLGDARVVIFIEGLADVLGPGSGPDTIQQFKTGAGGDVIGLSDLFWELDGGGSRNSANEYLTREQAFALGWLRLVQSGDDALVQVDGNGRGDGYATIIRLVNTAAADVAVDQIWV